MHCPACTAVRQYLVNWLLLLDMTLNVVLLGRPGELVSGRLGRAEAAGSKAAHALCRLLNWIPPRGKHCRFSADPTMPSVGDEIWHWSPTANHGDSQTGARHAAD